MTSDQKFVARVCKKMCVDSKKMFDDFDRMVLDLILLGMFAGTLFTLTAGTCIYCCFIKRRVQAHQVSFVVFCETRNFVRAGRT